MINHNDIRGEVVYRRTYSRPLNEEGTKFETWDQTIERVIGHQRWLWERAKDKPLEEDEECELAELKGLLLSSQRVLSVMVLSWI